VKDQLEGAPVLVVSAGMPKAGTAFLYNVINGVLIAGRGADARAVKDKYRLHRLMRWHNNNIGPLTFRSLAHLWLVSLRTGPFVVKTHGPPTRALLALMRLRLVKAIYIYRDPRDALLSAIDHGKRILEKGENHTFARMTDFDSAFAAVRRWLQTWQHYANLPGVLKVRYEDLVEQPVPTAQRVVNYLGLKLDEATASDIVATSDLAKQREPARDDTEQHFNKGVCYRYRTEMADAHRQRFRDTLGDTLLAMGYTLD
jgi:hypothetical protein